MTKCKKCNKEFKKGIAIHEKYCKGSNVIANGDIKQEKNTNEIKSGDIEQTNKKFNEINMVDEYNMNKEKIEPVKQEAIHEQEDNFQCGECNATFYRKTQPKFCPECGVGF